MRRSRLVVLSFVLLTSLVAVGCGSADDTTSGDDATEQGSTTLADGGADGGDEALSDGDITNPDNYAVYERLSVEPGGENVVREGGVVRAEKLDAYIVEVTEFGTGQKLNVSITSLEDNAAFYVYGPDGTVLSDTEKKKMNVDLNEGGDYVIEVGPTRGNTTYELTVNVSVNAG